MKQQEITSIQRSDHYDKNPELIRRYREGDELAGEEIVILNKPLVHSISQETSVSFLLAF